MALPKLDTLIRVPNETIRAHAALALCQISGRTNDGLPVLAGLMRTTDLFLRRTTFDLATELKADGLPIYQLALKDADAEIRRKALMVLGELGPAAHPAIPAMSRLLHDPKIFLRPTAADALQRIAPERAAEWQPAPAPTRIVKNPDKTSRP